VCLRKVGGSDISYGFGFLIIIFIISFLLVVYLFLATGYTQAGRQGHISGYHIWFFWGFSSYFLCIAGWEESVMTSVLSGVAVLLFLIGGLSRLADRLV